MILDVKMTDKEGTYNSFIDTDQLTYVLDLRNLADKQRSEEMLELCFRSGIKVTIVKEPELFDKLKGCLIGLKKHFQNFRVNDFQRSDENRENYGKQYNKPQEKNKDLIF